MIDNVLHEPNLVSYYQKEYLTLLNYYEQVSRPSIFIKYYNINMSSVYNEDSFSTYDYYTNSNIKFDIYEFTPVFFIQTVNNRPMYEDDKTGFSLQSQSGVVVNTIPRPKFNDLIEFYQPIRKSYEIFRVVNFTTVTNMLHSDPSSEWFELELEYAPIENCQQLNILNHYVYDLTLEKNITLDQYKEKLSKLELLEKTLSEINNYYLKNWDAYVLDYQYVPVALNELIYILKKNYSEKYKRIIEKYKLPYGFKTITNNPLPYYEKNPFFDLQQYDNIIDVFNLDSKEFEQYYWKDRSKYDNELEKLFYYSYQLAQMILKL